MGHHSCCNKQKVRRGLWSPEEDEKLINYISTYGHGCWSSVPRLAGLQRCGKSCRLRWINYLRPDLKRGSFSPQEESLIVELHRLLGNRWAQIAKHLPGRTDNEVKNFWNTSIKKKINSHGPVGDSSSNSVSYNKEDLSSLNAASNQNKMTISAQDDMYLLSTATAMLQGFEHDQDLKTDHVVVNYKMDYLYDPSRPPPLETSFNDSTWSSIYYHHHHHHHHQEENHRFNIYGPDEAVTATGTTTTTHDHMQGSALDGRIIVPYTPLIGSTMPRLCEIPDGGTIASVVELPALPSSSTSPQEVDTGGRFPYFSFGSEQFDDAHVPMNHMDCMDAVMASSSSSSSGHFRFPPNWGP